jgi:hypothetical protein
MKIMLTDELGNLHSVDVDPEMEVSLPIKELADEPQSFD